MTAPVQLLTVRYGDAASVERVLAEFEALENSGVARLIDVLVVRHTANGDIETVELAGVDAGRGSVLVELLTADESVAARAESAVWSVPDAVPVGDSAALLLVEHLWAEPLADAVSQSSGSLLDETWLGADDRAVLDAIIATRNL